MKTLKAGFAVILLSLFVLSDAQVISSQKSYLKIEKKPENVSNNRSTQQPARQPVQKVEDKTPPEISLMSHTLGKENTVTTTNPEEVIIGKITDNSGINSLMVNSKLTDYSDAGVFTTKVDLVPGDNEVIILALDNHDNFKNFRFNIRYEPIKKTLAETANSESVYYGLIIGINNYSDPSINSLDKPITDAESLMNVLTDEYTFEKQNIQYLPNAKSDDIYYALDNLARRVTPNDNLLIFYAGHGFYDEDSNVGYWLPSDARKISKADWFRNSTLVDYLKEIKSKHTLLITDACFGGSIFKTRSAFADTPKAIEMLYELPSRKAMTSGNLSEVPDQSSFSKYLIDRLVSNSDQYLSSEQLFSNLRPAVMNNSDAVPMYGEIQNVGDQGGDFIFIRK